MWLEVVITVVEFFVFWFLQNSLHEGSHLLSGFIEEGRRPFEFRPYPVKRDGRWYFAYYRFGVATIQSKKPWIVHSAPMRTDVWVAIIATLVTGVLWASRYERWWVGLFSVSMAVFDFLFFWYGYFWGSKYTDGKKYKYLKSKEV